MCKEIYLLKVALVTVMIAYLRELDIVSINSYNFVYLLNGFYYTEFVCPRTLYIINSLALITNT